MILEFLAEGFELIEAMTPVDVLRRAGADIKTVSISSSKLVKSANGVTVEADMLLSELPTVTPEMVILPGGMPGAKNLRENKTVCDTVLSANEKNIPIGAICAAPYILGELQLLQGKEAICYPGFEDKLHGAMISASNVVRDGNIITAAGMGVALPFALELVSILYGKEKAESILVSIRA